MNVTTLPANRQKAQHESRSGGRTTSRARYNDNDDDEYGVDGATALQPQRHDREGVRTRGRASADEGVREGGRRRSEQRPARLTVAPPAPVAAPRAAFVAMVLVLVLAGVVGILVLNTKIAENAFVLDDLHRRQSTLDRDEQQLKSNLANQESPAYLAAVAGELGLVKSTSMAFLLPDGTRLEMPGPSQK
jgi:hypothetical protein